VKVNRNVTKVLCFRAGMCRYFYMWAGRCGSMGNSIYENFAAMIFSIYRLLSLTDHAL